MSVAFLKRTRAPQARPAPNGGRRVSARAGGGRPPPALPTGLRVDLVEVDPALRHPVRRVPEVVAEKITGLPVDLAGPVKRDIVETGLDRMRQLRSVALGV